ncbi:MAG: hypothetical protein Ct9H300mP28_30950 [Pseudomonadota bacterium]|nr:MAG: hypothetical protein Ct9H300mP28_30950 [Pseudomonadota bacterium]
MEEASQTLRASRWQTFWTVSFPLMRPGLANAFFPGLYRKLGRFWNPLVLGGNFEVLSTQIFFSIVGAQGDPGMAGSAGNCTADVYSNSILCTTSLARKEILFNCHWERRCRVHVRLPKRVEWLAYLSAFPFLAMSLIVYGMILFGGFVETWGYKHNFTLKHYIAEFSLYWSDKHGLLWEGLPGIHFGQHFKYQLFRPAYSRPFGVFDSLHSCKTAVLGKRRF